MLQQKNWIWRPGFQVQVLLENWCLAATVWNIKLEDCLLGKVLSNSTEIRVKEGFVLGMDKLKK